ncbi:MAG TPA: glyoxylate/hydroxypyruvate reductase A [Alphaproteobacteria bacterium]
MPTLLFSSQADDPAAWTRALKRNMPELEIRVWPEVGDVRDIDIALVWRYPRGDLRRYPNLKLIYSLGAGVDHLLNDPDLPAGVPIARIVDPALTAGMSEYVLLAVLRYHRHLPEYERLQRERRWKKLPQPSTAERRVGILGMGELGRDAGTKLAALGFRVAGWSRRPKQIMGIESFAGEDALPAFLARTDILVCLLPLTPETRGLINAHRLAQLPRGAYVINAARGGHVVDADLIAALDSGHIAGATLDVFTPEPLPPTHPYWTHPKVTVTPHIASLTNPETASVQIAANIRRLLAGAPLEHLVDRTTGY